MRYFLGVDIGTSSAKIVVADENLRIISQEISSYGVEMPNQMLMLVQNMMKSSL